MIKLICSMLLILLTSIAHADLPTHRSNLSVSSGFHLIGSGLGGNISVTSPYFADDRFAVKVGYSQLKYSFISSNSNYEDFSIAMYDIGFIWSSFITDRLRGYWKIGLGLIAPPSTMSDNLSITGLSTFGLEYFPAIDSRLTFYAEVGGAYAVRGTAEKIPGGPPFGRGMNFVSGFKLYLF